ncbi:MAG: hypothetical protein JST40_12290 [Armatimonadetes bacterium]|nr:hypothetical protein [Armatimonadota bacterium]
MKLWKVGLAAVVACSVIQGCGGGGRASGGSTGYPASIVFTWDVSRAITSTSSAGSVVFTLNGESVTVDRPTSTQTVQVDFPNSVELTSAPVDVKYYVGSGGTGWLLMEGTPTLDGQVSDGRIVFNAGNLEPDTSYRDVRTDPNNPVTSNYADAPTNLALMGSDRDGNLTPIDSNNVSYATFDDSMRPAGAGVYGLWDGLGHIEAVVNNGSFVQHFVLSVTNELTSGSGTSISPTFVGHYADSTALRHWTHYPLVVRIVDSPELTEGGIEAIRSAMSAWQNRSDNRIKFREIPSNSSESADIAVQVSQALIDEYRRTSSPNAIGYCQSYFSGLEQSSATVVGMPSFQGTTDLWIHELGHALGLPHASIFPSVMQPALGSPFNVKDVNTVRYAHNDNFPVTGSRSRSRSTESEIIGCPLTK